MDLTKYDVVIVSLQGRIQALTLSERIRKVLLSVTTYSAPIPLCYPVANDWRNNIFRRMLLVLGKIPMFFLRILDKRAAKIPKYLIANSKEVAEGSEVLWERIYRNLPPVEIPEVKTPIQKETII